MLRTSTSPERALPLRASLILAALFLVGASGVACGNDTSARDQDKSPSAAAPTEIAPGAWAGEQLILTVTPSGTTSEFECAGGASKPLALDDQGRFDAEGTYASHPGGPATPQDADAPPLPARYQGRLIDARHLSLSVELVRTGQTLGPFALELGGTTSLQRCG